MRPRIKLIAVDLDGTLQTPSGDIHPHSATMLRRATADGIPVVLATSRGCIPAQAAARQLGLATPLITTNGAQVWAAPGGELWAEYPLSVSDHLRAYAQECGWPFTADSYMLHTQHPAGIAGLHTYCQEELDGQCRTELFYDAWGALRRLLVVAPAANKRTALTLILKRLKIRGKHVLAIGDNHNDIPMFSLAETSVAMEDAPPAVRVSATAVGPPSTAGGVGWAVERYVYDSLN